MGVISRVTCVLVKAKQSVSEKVITLFTQEESWFLLDLLSRSKEASSCVSGPCSCRIGVNVLLRGRARGDSVP